MKVKINKLETRFSQSYWVMLISCACLLLQMYAIPYGSTVVMSLSNRIMLLLWVGITIIPLLLRSSNVSQNLACFLMVLGFTLLSFALSVVQDMREAASSFTALVNFLALPLMLMYVATNEVDEKIKPIVLLTNIAMSLLFIHLSRTNLAHKFEGWYYTIDIEELTLGYPNPNQTAMYLFICAINLIVACFYFKNALMKVFCAVDFLYMLSLLEQTKARTGIILIGIFAIMVVFSLTRTVPKVWTKIAILTPLVYALAAQLLYPMLQNVKVLDEDLFNGREELYGDYFNNLGVITFVFGDFTEFQFANLHNAYISIAATGGIIVLYYYIRMLEQNIKLNLEMGLKKGYECVAFAGFLCVIIYASTEAAGLVGGMNYSFLALIMFMMFSKPFAKYSSYTEGEQQ